MQNISPYRVTTRKGGKFRYKPISGMLIAMIKIYQHVISPLVAPVCRYSPTCSQYGMDAINKYGPIKGGYLTVKRFMSCHPWGGSGYDPVP